MNSYMLNDYYAIRDNASGYFLDGKRLEKMEKYNSILSLVQQKGLLLK